MHDAEDLFEDQFKKPELQLDGMADHEPVYQPEDPGDDVEPSPDHENLSTKTEAYGEWI